MSADIFRKKGLCCISDRTLKTSNHLNLVALNYYCEWDYPYQSNLNIPGAPKQAISIVHDDYAPGGKLYDPKVLPKYAIELRGEDIVYHPVESLKKIIHPEKN